MSNEQQVKTEKYLTLTLGDELFALDIYAVREILDLTEITRIPHTAEHMLGVVNVRGSAVPVTDLGVQFGLGAVQRTLNTRIVILEIQRGDKISLIGAMADSVKEVLELPENQIDPAPEMGMKVKSDFIRGIGKYNGKFIILLHVNKVFSVEELALIEKHSDAVPTSQLDDGDNVDAG